MPQKPSSLRVKYDRVEELHEALQALAEHEVLVGFPEETGERQASDAPTNAMLGYIHDNGAPEANIPARPFMREGIERSLDQVTDILGSGARAALKDPHIATIEKIFDRVGFAAEVGIKRQINEGPPPPLAEMTLRRRAARGRKGAQEELDARAAGLPPSTALAKPLVDTGQMRNAVKYVIRKRTR